MSKPNQKPESFRLRMMYNRWYIYLYADAEEIDCLGPMAYDEAQTLITQFKADDVEDLDR